MNELPGWLKHGTVWLLLALGMFLGVQAWQARGRATQFTVDGQTIEIRRASDGHYHWPGSINGRAVDFLIDTGATGTAIPQRLALELGLPVLGSVQSRTANGVVRGEVVAGDLLLQGGVSAARLRMVALPDLATPLLGMDVLGRLRLEQDAGRLRIELDGARP